MKARIVRIGNSQGVCIPKPLLEQAGLADQVELQVTEDGLVIAPLNTARVGWAEAAQRLHERGEDGLLDAPTPTQFDESEWEWE